MYKPEFPKDVADMIQGYTKKKLPSFFEYAKNKTKEQIEPATRSLVCRIKELIPDRRIKIDFKDIGQFHYRTLLSNQKIVCPREVQDLYDSLARLYKFRMHFSTDGMPQNLPYLINVIRSEFRDIGYTNETITDMLVSYVYGENKKSKSMLWTVYGDYILENIRKNLKIEKVEKVNYIRCLNCGEWIEVQNVSHKPKYCEKCVKSQKNVYVS